MFRKRVIAINDLSGLGACSLAAALPVLSVLGIEPCPVPTAVLTNQTGYDSFFLHDCTELLPHYIEEWEKQPLLPRAIYTGFMTSEAQINSVHALIDRFKTDEVLLLVDPVMADNGKRYSTFTERLCDKVAELAARADVVTPNLTEACLLAGERYADYAHCADQPDFEARLTKLAEKIVRQGPTRVVITGVPAPDRHAVFSFALDAENGCSVCVQNTATPGGFSGTGDLLASAVCGGLVNGLSLDRALRATVRFLERAIAYTAAQGGNANDGVCFAPFLPLLHEFMFHEEESE